MARDAAEKAGTVDDRDAIAAAMVDSPTTARSDRSSKLAPEHFQYHPTSQMVLAKGKTTVYGHCLALTLAMSTVYSRQTREGGIVHVDEGVVNVVSTVNDAHPAERIVTKGT